MLAHELSSLIQTFHDGIGQLGDFFFRIFLYHFLERDQEGVALSSIQIGHGSDEEHAGTMYSLREVFGAEEVVLLHLSIVSCGVGLVCLCIYGVLHVLAVFGYHLIVRTSEQCGQFALWVFL